MQKDIVLVDSLRSSQHQQDTQIEDTQEDFLKWQAKQLDTMKHRKSLEFKKRNAPPAIVNKPVGVPIEEQLSMITEKMENSLDVSHLQTRQPRLTSNLIDQQAGEAPVTVKV